jgi:multidrug efflux pump subunit AcrA (membrane-fusion protein)
MPSQRNRNIILPPGSKGHNNRRGSVIQKKRIWKWLVLPVAVGVGFLLFYQDRSASPKRPGDRKPGRPEILVQVSPVIRKPLTYSLKATGDIVALMQVDLFPKVSGYLERIDVHLGEGVLQGQVLAQIDRSEFLPKVKEVEAKVGQAKAHLMELETGTRTEELRQAEETVKQTQSRFENAKLQRERVEALFKREVISKKEFDTADMEYKVTEAQLASSQQNLKLLQDGARAEVKDAAQAKLKEMEAVLAQEQIRLQNTRIVAPFHGEITRKYVETGALVSPSTPIVTLVHTQTLKVVANVIEKDVPLLKTGMKAKILVEAFPNKVFQGRIERINSALDPSTRTLQAEIYVPNPSRLLKPGMFAKLEVVLAEKPKALVVPREAVLDEKGIRSVFIVNGNQVIRKEVVIGIDQERFLEILDGLKEGEQVIVKGQESVRNGSTVRVVGGS